jgi:hypothetical protein
MDQDESSKDHEPKIFCQEIESLETALQKKEMPMIQEQKDWCRFF